MRGYARHGVAMHVKARDQKNTLRGVFFWFYTWVSKFGAMDKTGALIIRLHGGWQSNMIQRGCGIERN